MLKECTQHESSSSSSVAAKLGPHLVGFLSVLAISGSVALISFMGKGKLISQAHDDKEEAHSHSQGDYEEQKLHTPSHLDSSCEENEHSSTHLKTSQEDEPTRATLKRKKKVRFASDVVEPPSNGQQYRSNWRVSHECENNEPPCNDQVLEPPFNHHQHYKSKRRVSHRSGVDVNDRVDVDDAPFSHNVSQGYTTHTHLAHLEMPSKSSKASQGCEMRARSSHPLVSSSIPANRLALYKGLRQSRLQHSFHCL